MVEHEVGTEATILALEQRLLKPEQRSSGDELERVLANGFREFGSSGSVYDKQQAIRAGREHASDRY